MPDIQQIMNLRCAYRVEARAVLLANILARMATPAKTSITYAIMAVGSLALSLIHFALIGMNREAM